jgi:multidrug efflux pump subunit AcrA (membrane-fusion protein)
MSPDPSVQSVSRRGLRIAACVAVAIAVLVVSSGIATRASNAGHLRQLTDAQAQPVVTVTAPEPGGASYAVELPGRPQAYSRAPIYARVSGYLKSWNADIGSPVQAGQLLAEIEAPDLDQQLSQAKGDLMTAQANAALATTTAVRWQQLFKTDSVSRQDVDMKNGDFAAKEAIVKATKANVDDLRLGARRDSGDIGGDDRARRPGGLQAGPDRSRSGRCHRGLLRTRSHRSHHRQPAGRHRQG